MTRRPRHQRNRILRYLLKRGTRATAMQIQTALKMPQGTVRRELPALCRDLLVDYDGWPKGYGLTMRAGMLAGTWI